MGNHRIVSRRSTRPRAALAVSLGLAAAALLAAACGDDSPAADGGTDAASIDASIDAASIDAAIDAASIDATIDAASSDAAIDAAAPADAAVDAGLPDVDAGDPLACDPVAQIGCPSGQKCTWVRTGDGFGLTTCAPDGTIPVDGACETPTIDADACVAGSICIHGLCETICSDSPDTCGAQMACTTYSGLFDGYAGACDYTCNPVDQTRDIDGAPACGSPDPAVPTRGCYGLANGPFTCTPAGDPEKTYRVPAVYPDGNVYRNGCAPGYAPLLGASFGDQELICIAFCDPDAIFQGHTTNANGEAPHTCAAAGGPGWSDLEPAGSPDGVPEGDAAECRQLWWLSSVPSAAENHIGFCFDFALYDVASCGTLPESDQAGGNLEGGCAPYQSPFARAFRISLALFRLASHTAAPALPARP